MIFFTTLEQMAFLFSLIILGYVLMKFKVMPENSNTVLSKLENYVFIPALVLDTFSKSFTIEALSSNGSLMLFSLGIEIIVIPLSILCANLITKDSYIRKIYTYGLAFANFSFMGNAVVEALFPNELSAYIIFTLVLWTLIYLWGIPSLLVCDDSGEKKSIKDRLKNFVNPLFICVLIGIAIGLSGITLPGFASSAVNSAKVCMSPCAMLITGMTLAKMNLGEILKTKSIYVVTALRLLVFPAIFLGVYMLFGKYVDKGFAICALVSIAMPLGLNTIVIPSAYGKDTRIAAGMALVSHVIAIATVPVVFYIWELIM